MAIQNRRGIYSDFDPTKMVEGEFAVVQSGDPNTSDGKAVYIAPTTGTAERVALYKDVQQEVQAAITDATDEVIQEVTAGIIEGVAEDVTKAETAATNAETSAQNAEASAEEAQEVLENKADNNGYYPDLYAGNLSSTRKQTDSVPYLMRKTGGTLSRVGERCYDTIIGASVVENQLVKTQETSASQTVRGITVTDNRDGSFTLNGTVSETGNIDIVERIPLNNGHKYAVLIGSDVCFTDSQSYSTTKGNRLLNATSSAKRTFNLYVISGNTFTNYLIYPQCIDLTAELGTSIADYLYSIETATEGAGIAKLKEWGFLTDEYIPYNAGSLESVEVTGKKVVGFNQWDEEWEEGRIDNGTGQPVSSSINLRSKNFIPIMPNTTYYGLLTPNMWMTRFYYDENYNYLAPVQTSMNGTFVTPSNARYMKFRTESEKYPMPYNHDICINLSSDRNGEYEPYSAHTYDIGTDTLRGLFKLDSNNNLYADGDTKTSDGTVTRNIVNLTLDGTEDNWFEYPSAETELCYLRGVFNNAIPKYLLQNGWGICDKLICVANVLSGETAPGSMSSSTANNGKNLYIKFPSGITSLTAFKTWLGSNPIHLDYIVNTPTTEQSTPFTSPQIVYPDGTEEFVTENGLPVGHETEYPYDLKGLVEGLIDVPDVPSANGTYVLKATRSASGITYAWVSD